MKKTHIPFHHSFIHKFNKSSYKQETMRMGVLEKKQHLCNITSHLKFTTYKTNLPEVALTTDEAQEQR